MDSKQKIKILELSFQIMENLLMSKNFVSKQEVMASAKKAVEISSKDAKMPIEVKIAYAEAYNKLNGLTWEEMQEIKASGAKVKDKSKPDGTILTIRPGIFLRSMLIQQQLVNVVSNPSKVKSKKNKKEDASPNKDDKE